MAELLRLQAIVRGEVQGVGFRFFVVDKAQALGLVGRVRNMADGYSVMVEAEGEPGRLEQLLSDLRRGPAGARVERVEAAWLDYRGAFQDFAISR